MGGFDTSAALGVAVSGNYVYVADGGAGLLVIDVSNPANPQRVGGFDTSGGAVKVAVSDGYAYLAQGDAGLLVIDVSDPAHPRRVGGNGLASGYDITVNGESVFASGTIFNVFTPLNGPPLSLIPLPRPEQDGCRVLVQGLPGLPVQVERSVDLLHWQTWTNGLLRSGPLEFLDVDAGQNPRQFYRALAQ